MILLTVPTLGHLTGADRALFHLINEAWTNPLLDRAMPALSRVGNLGAVWFTMLSAMAAFGNKMGRKAALASLAAFAIGFASSELIKEATLRPRPFAVLSDARLLVPEPGSFAFPSGHATSAFAAASGAVLAARRLSKRVPPWGWGMLALAAAISYSRVYVGVHWPSDVAAGVVLGLASGWAGARLVGGRVAALGVRGRWAAFAKRRGLRRASTVASGCRSGKKPANEGSGRKVQ